MNDFKPEYFSDYQRLSFAASDLIMDRVTSSNSILIGVATGFSPLRAYQLVAKKLRARPDLRDKIQIFQLDEWLGVSSKNIQSCQHFIDQNILRPWQISTENCFLLEGDDLNPHDQIRRMSEYLSKRPIDLCILGLGTNGHLALNEPGSVKSDSSRITELAEPSQSHPMLKDLTNKVAQGITIGLKEILESKEILLIISGKKKAAVTRQLLSEDSISNLPACVLFEHPNWHCYIDKNALN